MNQIYTVKSGDTVSGIAAHFGIPFAAILHANQSLTDPNQIRVGQHLIVPMRGDQPIPPLVSRPVPGHPHYDGLTPAPGCSVANKAAFNGIALASASGQRDANLYSQVIDQYAVEHNGRYVPAAHKTYCNIFSWDVTRAMGAEIPHWVTQSGTISAPGVSGSHELVINSTVEWMLRIGLKQHGWNLVSAVDAQTAANSGNPAVVMWKNPDPGSHGHIAVVRPGVFTTLGATIAQAGAKNHNHTTVKYSFPAAASPLFYFTHI